MQDFRNLQVWQKSHGLTLHVYRSTKQFPGEERFGLTSQLRRASSSYRVRERPSGQAW